ncbi:MAG: hypothetical protein LBS39_05105 [Campylobacteraceae bacterium]|jgi:hypothetical protein|nr:hypothetical protein [Campylobacteraceae bacterium]
MTNKELSFKLKEIGLSRKEFAQIIGYKYQTVLNWSRNPVPPFVDSWIENYIHAKKYKDLIASMLQSQK